MNDFITSHDAEITDISGKTLHVFIDNGTRFGIWRDVSNDSGKNFKVGQIIYVQINWDKNGICQLIG